MNCNAIINSPKYTHWTVGAAECYKRGGVCNGCETFELIGKQCRMKASVISLVKYCGPPPDNIMEKEGYHQDISVIQQDNERVEDKENKMQEEKLTKKETEIRDLLLQGLNYKRITEKLVISMATLKSHINSIFQKRDYHSLQDLLIGENKRQDKEIIEYVITKKQEDPKPKNNERIEKDMIKIKTNNNKIYDADLDYAYGKSYAPIIKAIKDGLKTNQEISEETGINKNFLSVKYRDFCVTLGHKYRHQLEGKTNLDKIIDFVQKRLNKSECPNIETKPDNINIPVKRKTDADYIKELTEENKKLREEISELTKKVNEPKLAIDFDKIRHDIMTEIDKLNAKLQAIELLEREFTNG